jgi:hypothetical protein
VHYSRVFAILYIFTVFPGPTRFIGNERRARFRVGALNWPTVGLYIVFIFPRNPFDRSNIHRRHWGWLLWLVLLWLVLLWLVLLWLFL